MAESRKRTSRQADHAEAAAPEADTAEAEAPEAEDAPAPVAEPTEQTVEAPPADDVAPVPDDTPVVADKIPVAKVETFGMGGSWGYDALDLYGRKLTSSEAVYATPEEARQAAPTEV